MNYNTITQKQEGYCEKIEVRNEMICVICVLKKRSPLRET